MESKKVLVTLYSRNRRELKIVLIKNGLVLAFFSLVAKTFFLRFKSCFICGEIAKEGYICSSCKNKFHPIYKPYCLKCGYPSLFPRETCSACSKLPIKYMRSLFLYSGQVKKLLCSWKDGHKFFNRFLLQELYHHYFPNYFDTFPPIDFIVPVPSSLQSFNARGFSHTNILARSLFKSEPDIILSNIFVKKIFFKKQKTLVRSERIKRSGVFAVRKNKLKLLTNKRILLFDDVATTLSTIHSVASALKKSGPKEIIALSFARTLFSSS